MRSRCGVRCADILGISAALKSISASFPSARCQLRLLPGIVGLHTSNPLHSGCVGNPIDHRVRVGVEQGATHDRTARATVAVVRRSSFFFLSPGLCAPYRFDAERSHPP
jgi:hypothetical protein